MANTFKFGNGEWAVGKETALAYNDENSNFKPLPFTFDRASTATVVNKDGLIETVGVDEPRIDFSNDSKGALLLEPIRSNRITYSEDLTQWTDYNASAVLSNETIYGKNAYKIVEDSTVNYHGIYLTNLFTADGTNYVWSVYVKGAERRYVVLTGRAGISSNDSALIFDTQDGVWTLDSSSQNQALSAESVGNGWWRISMEGNPTSGAYDNYTIAASLGGSVYTDANYQGDGTSGIYVAMPQLEQGSYATSYIPTQGSIETRLAETCSQTPPDGVIGQTEGVLFIDFTPNTDTISTKWLSFLGGGSQYIGIYVVNTSNVIRLEVANTTNQATFNSSFSITKGTRYKCAIAYANNDFTAYINGVQLGTVTNGSVPTTSTLKSYYNLNSIESFNTKDLRLYNTRLSDSELQTLTQV